ncbi:hypothetical protein BaRGS_00017763 [Batillaria attramentaria]|uniref:Glycosyltransferase family 32 protein n=1 Tax=Batillaria attramentaria TaxID=370345 RepID=A0ABD0KWD1_9CAEN
MYAAAQPVQFSMSLSGWVRTTRVLGWRPIMRRQSVLCCVLIPFLSVVTLLLLGNLIRKLVHENRLSVDNLPLFRDVHNQEAWPGVELGGSRPGQVPHTVHYLWCGSKEFHFQHYLGVLSAIRILRPIKIVFHYTHLPQLDEFWYHTWFLELKQSVSYLVLHRLDTADECGSEDLLDTMIGLLSEEGGVYLGENVILTRIPDDTTDVPFWFAFSDSSWDMTRGIVFARESFEASQEVLLENIVNEDPGCVSVEMYNMENPTTGPECITVVDDVYPRDIWTSHTHFGELARWLYYGRRAPLSVQPSQHEAIPRISHYTWLKSTNPAVTDEFDFSHFLSVLSALYVAGLEHVYVHGDEEPSGEWWEELANENVTFVRVQRPETIFQQEVDVGAHISDILRYGALNRYGGVYQDRDVVWVSRLPGWLLAYPTVACPEWPHYGQWPDTINIGVLLARRQAPWIRHFLPTNRYFRDDDWNWNAVICAMGECHPAWLEDPSSNVSGKSREPFDWREARAVHFRKPKLPPSLASPRDVMEGKDIFAEIGRHVLEMSGRKDLLE